MITHKAMLKIKNITLTFNGFKAVNNVSLEIKQGEILGLIGPNGAGKTTLFNILAGNLMPSSGEIFYQDENITKLQDYQRFHKGIVRTFQITKEFESLSVMENIMVVANNQLGEKLFTPLIFPKKIKVQEEKIKQKALEILDFLEITPIKNQCAANISGGQKKLVELARAMMAPAKIILLDEIAAGVNRTLLRKLEDKILELNKNLGYTFLIIEHDMEMIKTLCNRVICMNSGEILTQGCFDEVVNNKDVLDAYLGG